MNAAVPKHVEPAERLARSDDFEAKGPGEAPAARPAWGSHNASHDEPLPPDAPETYTAHAAAGAAVQFNRV